MADELAEGVQKDWIIEGLGGGGDLIAVVGKPGSGKSAFALEMARAVASGVPFFGRTVERGAALILAFERPHETDRRLRAMKPILHGSIAVCDNVPFLDSDLAVDRIVATARLVSIKAGAPVRLIIVDTFARMAEGLEENSAKEVGPMLRRLSVLGSETGACIVLVHHTGHTGQNARGSSALLAAFDLQILVKKDAGKSRCTAQITKSNIGPEGAKMSFTLEPFALDGAGDTAVLARNVADFASGDTVGQLPRDSRTCLDVLNRWHSGCSLTEWQKACFDALGERKEGALRQAFSNAKRVLVTEHVIVIVDGFVSISKRQIQSDLA